MKFHVVHGTKRWKDPNRRFVENGVPAAQPQDFHPKKTKIGVKLYFSLSTIDLQFYSNEIKSVTGCTLETSIY